MEMGCLVTLDRQGHLGFMGGKGRVAVMGMEDFLGIMDPKEKRVL